MRIKMRKLDNIILTIIIFILNCIWLSYLFEKLEMIIFISLLLVILLKMLILHISNRYSDKKTISMEDTFTIFAMDKLRTLIHINNLIPESYGSRIDDGYIVFSNKLLLVNFSFSEIGFADISRAFNYANANNLEKVIVLTNKISRKTLLFCNRLPIPFVYYDRNKLFHKLKNANGLPKSIFIYEKAKKKIYLSQIFWEIFNKKRAKYFLFTSLVLIFTSLFTPLKLYYNILITISLLCSILCMVKKD